MSIIELLEKVGIENVQVQPLALAQDSISTNKRGESTISFGTKAVTAHEQAMESPTRKIGLILWLPNNLLPPPSVADAEQPKLSGIKETDVNAGNQPMTELP